MPQAHSLPACHAEDFCYFCIQKPVNQHLVERPDATLTSINQQTMTEPKTALEREAHYDQKEGMDRGKSK